MRRASLILGKRKEAKPMTHWRPKRRTALRPSQLCSEYMLGMGVAARLCESKTALRAMEAKTRTAMCITPCTIFTAILVVSLKSL